MTDFANLGAGITSPAGDDRIVSFVTRREMGGEKLTFGARLKRLLDVG